MAKRLPKRIYVERWPESAGREDQIHYEPTGYGIDVMSGTVSRITVYERVEPPKRKPKASRGKAGG